MREQTIEGFQLSPQQARLWRLQADGTSFRAACVLLLEGDLDARRLRDAAHELVRRHSILRTTFRSLPGMKLPLQVVGGVEARADWRCEEGSRSERRLPHAEAAELARQQEAEPFDFEHGPLLRVTLKTLSPGEHLLLISLPSLCADARTLAVLAGELGSLYRTGGATSPADDCEAEELEYSRFADWRNELLADEDAEQGRAYWGRLRPPSTHDSQLACESAPPDVGSFDPRACGLTFTPEYAARIAVAADELGCPTDTFLLATWQTLLWRLTGQDEVVLANVCDGRGHELPRDACGLFTHALPVRTSFEPWLPFRELARQTLASVGEAAAWQDYFTGQSAGDGAGEPSPDSFPFLFAYEEWHEGFNFGPLACTLLHHDACAERFKLCCAAVRRGGELRAELRYDAARFRAGDIEYLLGLYDSLLCSAVTNPERPVGELDVLGAAERRRVLVEFNRTAADFARDVCVHEQFEAQVERTPDAPAVVFRDQQLTYRRLNEMANSLARHLQGLGIGPEVVAGLFIERSVEMLVGLLGILKAGGAYLPLDPAQPAERLAYLLEDAAAPVVLTTSRLLSFLPEGRAATVLLDADWDEIARQSAANLSNHTAPENLAYVIYTSGSTGRPKGVMVQHRSLSNLVAALDAAVYRHLRPAARVSLNAPLTFDASVKQWSRLLRGHTLVVLPEEVRPDARELLRYVAQHEVEVLDCTPMQLKALLAAGRPEERGGPAVVLVGGEELDEATWALLAAGEAARFYNLYGLTECTVDSAVARVRPGSTRRTIGRPLGNTQIYLLDGRLRPVPVGVAGEMYVGGLGLARGYLGRPALTAERFVPDPFSAEPGARLYRTGDLARHLPDGRIEFLGRLDHQLKVRGFRVEPGEIEAALAEHPAVREAVVLASRGAGGREEARLVAYVVPRRDGLGGQAAAVSDLQGFLRRRLPEYMIPADFILLEQMPLTHNGKLNRQGLPDWAASASRARPPYASPRNELERVIADIWRQVLNVERVGIHDNFFDLGGHSLLLTYAYNQLRQSLDREFSIVEMFHYPTVSSLAQHLGAGGEATLEREQIRARVEKQREFARGRQAALKEQR